MVMLESLLNNRIIVFYQSKEFFEDIWSFCVKYLKNHGVECVCRRNNSVSTIVTSLTLITFVKPNGNAKGRVATQVFLEPGISRNVVDLLVRPTLAKTECGDNCYVIKIKDHDIYKTFYAENADTFYMKNETSHQISFDEYMETL